VAQYIGQLHCELQVPITNFPIGAAVYTGQVDEAVAPVHGSYSLLLLEFRSHSDNLKRVP
jgi:hypothetical protein